MTHPVKDTPKVSMPAKTSILPLILAVMAGGLATFVLSQLKFSVWIDTSSTEDPNPPVIDVAPRVLAPTQTAPTQTAPTQAIPKPSPPLTAAVPDGLRVKNQSAYALRVVLLTQKNTSFNQQDPYRTPVHWDFAPQEGIQNGLLLSLPEGDLTLATGDVLVAFALDGSRRYWGPYIVGQSAQPIQSSTTAEWQLLLK